MNIQVNAGVRIPPDCMRVRQAAGQIGCNERTVLRMIEHGEIRAVRIGRRYWAVHRADVNRVAIGRAELW